MGYLFSSTPPRLPLCVFVPQVVTMIEEKRNGTNISPVEEEVDNTGRGDSSFCSCCCREDAVHNEVMRRMQASKQERRNHEASGSGSGSGVGGDTGGDTGAEAKKGAITEKATMI